MGLRQPSLPRETHRAHRCPEGGGPYLIGHRLLGDILLLLQYSVLLALLLPSYTHLIPSYLPLLFGFPELALTMPFMASWCPSFCCGLLL